MKFFAVRKIICRGFTLVEALLYIGISAVVLTAIALMFSMLFYARVKTRTISEVDHQGIHILQVLSNTIRNAEGINQPVIGTSDATLSLEMPDPEKNPTVLSFSDDTLYIREGAGPVVPLHSTKTRMSNLTFENLSRTNTPGVVRIQFLLSYKNWANRNEYEYANVFNATTSLR